jgi:GAF domain-containing protein
MARPAKTGDKRSAAKSSKAGSAKGRKPKTQTQKSQAVGPQQLADLRRQLNEARTELGARNSAYGERIAFQAATNDVLKMMSASPGDPQPVFDLISVRARDLCDAYGVTVYEFDGTLLHWRAATGVSDDPAVKEAAKAAYPTPLTRDLLPGRAMLTRATVHIRDIDADPELRRLSPTVKSSVAVPMMRGDTSIGALGMGSRERGGFSDSQVELLKTFADQAVIAIENARLFNETREALGRQTATAEILKVIATSPSDAQPVFDAIAERSKHLVSGRAAAVHRIIDDQQHLMAITPISPEADATIKAAFPRPLSVIPGAEQLRKGEVFQATDTERDFADHPALLDMMRRRGSRSIVIVPLMRDGSLIGLINVSRGVAGHFDLHHVELLQTFADQAVIAIENARLFSETKELLEQQTATSAVLQVINSSPRDLGPIFDAMLEKAIRLCDGIQGTLWTFAGEQMLLAVSRGLTPNFVEKLRETRERQNLGEQDPVRRIMRGERLIQVLDIAATRSHGPVFESAAESGGVGTIMVVGLFKDEAALGAFVISRREVRPFTEKQVALLQTFADQAVIAIQNVKLFNEVQARTHDLEESLRQQTATANVLKVISASPGELAPVFQTLLENAVRLCEAKFGMLLLLENDHYRAVETWNVPSGYGDFLASNRIYAAPQIPLGRILETKQPVQVTDLHEDVSYLERHPGIVAVTELGGARTLVQVPMLQDDQLIGSIGIYRQEVRPFEDKQVALVQNFAAQAVIAVENARLLNELRQRTADLSRSLEDLRAAQDRLIQTEKLASLGQLAAGIAHEIKNPLNFVNNFSGMSAELIGELQEVVGGLTIDPETHADIKELTEMLGANLEKIVHHGKRADGIVKSMLLHSGESSGEHQLSDINALVDESLNRAYYGERAETRGFMIKLEKSFDPTIGEVELFPREVSRAVLNLISNAFYATSKRRETEGSDYEPVLVVATRNLGKTVEIRIRDNGTGISSDVREKMFNPFFTTKPTGEGTGLGLSMTHDIIVKQHGGRIDVETEPGEFSEFIITLPRGNGTAAGSKPE